MHIWEESTQGSDSDCRWKTGPIYSAGREQERHRSKKSVACDSVFACQLPPNMRISFSSRSTDTGILQPPAERLQTRIQVYRHCITTVSLCQFTLPVVSYRTSTDFGFCRGILYEYVSCPLSHTESNLAHISGTPAKQTVPCRTASLVAKYHLSLSVSPPAGQSGRPRVDSWL